MKIELDKYYTPKEVAEYCVNVARRAIKEKIHRIIEPSAGSGAFLEYLPNNTIALDIAPENDIVIKQDYLTLDIRYEKGTLVIGNPPFGEKMNLVQKFFKKSIEVADYVAFILPISQLWNTNSLYEFDLIHSEDLGLKKYSGVKLHCCYNIYKRPDKGLNSKPNNKLKSVDIVRQDSKKFNSMEYDIKLCYWGNSCAGKILKDDENLSAMYKIKVSDDFKYEVKNVLGKIDWRKELNCIAMLKIQQFHIIKILKKYIPDIV